MTARELASKVALVTAAVVIIGGSVTGSALSAKLPGKSVTASVACTRGYKPCIPDRRSDVDCYGGGGNGPRYTKPGVTYRVRGSDRYGLDGDNDGWGCE
jgi:hypothetical protein